MSTPLEPRLRRRRRLLLATILPAIVLIVLALRFLTLPGNMGTAREAHGGDDGPGMVAAGEKLGILNIVERWRAPFVEGTGRSVSGDLDGGRADLEEALSRTGSPQDDCTVRTNLVITISQQADEAKESGDPDAEKKLAEEGLKVIEEGPQGCLDGSKDGNGGDAGRKQQEQKEKLEKQSGQDDSEDSEGEEEEKEEEGPDGEEDPQQKELEKRNDAGQQTSEQERRDKEAQEKGKTEGVQKPW